MPITYSFSFRKGRGTVDVYEDKDKGRKYYVSEEGAMASEHDCWATGMLPSIEACNKAIDDDYACWAMESLAIDQNAVVTAAVND